MIDSLVLQLIFVFDLALLTGKQTIVTFDVIVTRTNSHLDKIPQELPCLIGSFCARRSILEIMLNSGELSVTDMHKMFIHVSDKLQVV